MSAKSTVLAYEWSTIKWHIIECQVYKLQKRIYQASKDDDKLRVHKLQKLLLKSNSARLLAVRRVTQDNRGKRTAGIDGKKSLKPEERIQLVKELNLNHRPKAVRRIYIPKSNSKEKRPLGIPTIYDRAIQALVKLALEPEWEAKFEPNSYGFRPARCTHDAIMAIFNSIKQKPKFVLDADIEKCFDKINHDRLLDTLDTFPTLRRLIKGWLKSGIIEKDVFKRTPSGTPQGGVISPLLANIALHGMETHIQKTFPIKDTRRKGVRIYSPTPSVIRYADDFVIIHPNIEVVKACKKLISEWLVDIGLNLKESKTSICHTLNKYKGEEAGFDFLGFNIRQYPVSNKHSGRRTRGGNLGYKNIIKPSKKATKKYQAKLREIVRGNWSSPQVLLIQKLNPVIIGWCNYYNKTQSSQTFSKMDDLMYQRLRRWAFRRHNNKSRRWIVDKYWRIKETGKWIFGTPDGESTLAYHRHFKIKSHIQVKGSRSPYDGDWAYWGKRLRKFPLLTPMQIKLLKKQEGKCNWCILNFKSEDLMVQDHIIPRAYGGTHRMDNLQLLHQHCHHQKTTKDIELYKGQPKVKRKYPKFKLLRNNS